MSKPCKNCFACIYNEVIVSRLRQFLADFVLNECPAEILKSSVMQGNFLLCGIVLHFVLLASTHEMAVVPPDHCDNGRKPPKVSQHRQYGLCENHRSVGVVADRLLIGDFRVKFKALCR